jgi:hypothetical protein
LRKHQVRTNQFIGSGRRCPAPTLAVAAISH